MSNKKGIGSRVNNCINMGERYALLKWCETHTDNVQTYRELSVQASLDLGMVITESCLQNHWITVNGPRKHVKARPPTLANMQKDIGRLAICIRHAMDVLEIGNAETHGILTDIHDRNK